MFISRRVDNTIYGLWTVRQSEGQEELADNDPAVLAFLAPKVPDAAAMNAACIAGTATPPPPQFGFDLQRAFISKCISDEAYRLGVNPGALTALQIQSLRNRLANIYQAL